MENISRRKFGKTMAMGPMGGLAIGSVAPLALGQGASQSVKRMTTVLREMINRPGLFACPGVYDPLTARIAERTGFRVIDLPGSALGYATTMIEPNLSLEDMAEATRSITSAVNIPLIVDAGAGFGEPAHVIHTVQVLEHAGAAGMHLEDQIFPKRFSYHEGVEHTIPAKAMIDKIKYAIEGRRDPDFVIVARTDTILTNGFAEGVRRANLYLEAGAQMIMLFPRTPEEVRQLPKEVHGPINWVQSFRPDQPPEFPLQDLQALGGDKDVKGSYKVVNYPHVIYAAYQAVRDILVHLHETGTTGMDRNVFAAVQKDVREAVNLQENIHIESLTTEKP